MRARPVAAGERPSWTRRTDHAGPARTHGLRTPPAAQRSAGSAHGGNTGERDRNWGEERASTAEAGAAGAGRRGINRSKQAYPSLALDARDCFASARAVARAACRHRTELPPRHLAVAAMVRFAGAVANRGGFAIRATRDSAQPGLPHPCGVAADAVDRTRAGFRAPARIPGWRHVLGDRLEVHGASRSSGDAAVPVGTEAGSLFRSRPVAGVRGSDRPSDSH